MAQQHSRLRASARPASESMPPRDDRNFAVARRQDEAVVPQLHRLCSRETHVFRVSSRTPRRPILVCIDGNPISEQAVLVAPAAGRTFE
jgi:hypothetical protein